MQFRSPRFYRLNSFQNHILIGQSQPLAPYPLKQFATFVRKVPSLQFNKTTKRSCAAVRVPSHEPSLFNLYAQPRISLVHARSAPKF
jgi:hypothetical protein